MKVERTMLPLMGMSFEPGEMTDIVKKIEDEELADIAQAEAYYYSAQPEKCVGKLKEYLNSEDIYLRLSADVLFAFANMSLENEKAVWEMRDDVQVCLKHVWQDNENNEVKAACLFAWYIVSVLIHIPPENEFSTLYDYLRYLPKGQRMFTIHIMVHSAYLNGEYEKGIGMAQVALTVADRFYPVSFVYMKCAEAMCQINLKRTDEAEKAIREAGDVAKADGCLEPFAEYYSLLQGVCEKCIKKNEPGLYKEMMEKVIHFSKGWRKVHNQITKKHITDLLTPVEFSIAMLACRDWTNQEIATHMNLSVNTVKRYVSVILEKLQINKRDGLKEFVNQ